MILAVIQARVGSHRLPRKVLQRIGGRTMLSQVVHRLRQSRHLTHLLVATSDQPDDVAVVAEAHRCGVDALQGPEHDVLERFAMATRCYRPDVVVRITADCPLIDGGVVDRAIERLLTSDGALDYVSNADRRSFPRGLDVEVMYGDVVARMARMATSAPAREHVTAFLRERPSLFSVGHLVDDADNSDLRWTVDTAEDLRLVRMLHDQLVLEVTELPYLAIVAHVRKHPQLVQINRHVCQKPTFQAA